MTSPEIDEHGNQWWYNQNRHWHRTDGPAIIWRDGTQEWYLNGKYHRTDGPAVIFSDRTCSWYINSKQVFTNKQFQKAANLSDEEMTLIILKYGSVE